MIDNQHLTPCSRCAVFGVCYTSGLVSKDLVTVESNVEHLRLLHKGQHLFYSKVELKGVYAVRHGSVKIVVIDNEGNEKISSFFLAGDMFSFVSVDTCKFRFSIIALELTSLCVVSFEKLFLLGAKVPALRSCIFNLMGQKLNFNKTYFKQEMPGQIARFILGMFNKVKRYKASVHEFTLSMSFQDIASYFDTSLECINNFFAELQEKGMFTIEKNKITICDLNSLENLATFRIV